MSSKLNYKLMWEELRADLEKCREHESILLVMNDIENEQKNICLKDAVKDFLAYVDGSTNNDITHQRVISQLRELSK